MLPTVNLKSNPSLTPPMTNGNHAAPSPAAFTATNGRIVTGCGHKVNVEIALVTPDMAAEYLQGMVANRRPKRRNLELLTREMKTGGWRFNGEPLIFDEDDELLNGQHRCLAAIASGHAFATLIVRGVPRGTFDRMDCGAKRSAGDILGMHGVKHRDMVAAAVGNLMGHRDGHTWYAARQGGYASHEIAAGLRLFPGLEDYAALASELNRVVGYRGSSWLSMIYLTAQIDPALSRSFFSQVNTGLGLGAADPEYLLRRRLLDFRGRKFVVTQAEFAALVTNGWNARRKNRKLSVLRGLVGDSKVPEMI